jgi:hypothetical protein
VTVEQLNRTDREVWRFLALACRQGVRRGPDGARPLDVQLPLALVDPTVRMHLLPLPSGSGAGRGGAAAPDTGASASKRRADSLAAENKRLRSELAASRASGPGGGKGAGTNKGKAKGKGRGFSGLSSDQYRPKMPAGLIGKAYRAPNGDNICFSFNLPGGCSGAPPGSKCTPGAHVCAEPGCGQAHSLTEHS